MLYRVARLVTENPDGIIRDVFFPEVGEETFHRLVKESEQLETRYDLCRTRMMKRKYNRHYRRMMGPVLDVLTFHANNSAYYPLLAGLDLVHRYLNTKHIYYPEHETIPEELLSGIWREVIFEDRERGQGVVKKYFELCVLGKLERALKCKEVWVEGSYRYRNPDQDLPTDWKERRVDYYQKHAVPLEAEDFIGPIQKEMLSAFARLNGFLNRRRDVYIYHPRGGERGLFHVPKIPRRPEQSIIQQVKATVFCVSGEPWSF